MGQRNSTESPELNPHICDQLIPNKGAKNILWGKDYSTNGVEKLDRYVQKNESGAPYYTTHDNKLKAN